MLPIKRQNIEYIEEVQVVKVLEKCTIHHAMENELFSKKE